MSHYAKVLNGKVINVIVAEADFFNTFVDTSPGQWIQTSYNTKGNKHPENKPLRGNFAGIGYIYDAINDVFYSPQPYPSWTLNKTTWLWDSPIPYPTDNKAYKWDEATKSWVVIE
jgi:hypothetical protein